MLYVSYHQRAKAHTFVTTYLQTKWRTILSQTNFYFYFRTSCWVVNLRALCFLCQMLNQFMDEWKRKSTGRRKQLISKANRAAANLHTRQTWQLARQAAYERVLRSRNNRLDAIISSCFHPLWNREGDSTRDNFINGHTHTHTLTLMRNNSVWA